MTTTPAETRRCGFPNFRCSGCETATAAPLDTCPRCQSNDIQPSTCRKPLRDGAVRCYLHGGRTPQVAAAATTRTVESKLAALLEEYDVGPCVDPFQALLDLAGQAIAWKDLLGDRVAQLAANDWRYEGRTGEQVRSEVTLFERAIDRCGRILADVARLGLDERLLAFHRQISEAQANAWADVLDATLVEVLPPDLTAAVQLRFGQRMTATVGVVDLPPLAEMPRYVRADSITSVARPTLAEAPMPFHGEERGAADAVEPPQVPPAPSEAVAEPSAPPSVQVASRTPESGRRKAVYPPAPPSLRVGVIYPDSPSAEPDTSQVVGVPRRRHPDHRLRLPVQPGVHGSPGPLPRSGNGPGVGRPLRPRT